MSTFVVSPSAAGASLSDAAARERATEDTHLSLALSAGAGSGKTSVLVARLVNVLRKGTPPERVAVITFTVKAAGELVERVRDALEEALANASGVDRDALLTLLEQLPRLTLSTIHSFCGELLRSEALAAEWAPGTAVLGEIYAPSSVEAGFAAWRSELSQRRPVLLTKLRRDAKVTDHTLREAALRLLEHRDLAIVRGRAAPDFGPARAHLGTIASDLLATAARCLNPAGCKLLGNNRELLAGLAALGREAGEAGEAAVRLVHALEDSKVGGTAKDWPNKGNDDFKGHIDRLRTWRDDVRPLLWEPLHGELVSDLVDHFIPHVARAKSDAAQVDFQDLLFFARDLLETRPEASARLARRFDAILVDEVQDTDPLQSAIVMRLARDPTNSGDAAWDAHPPRPGSVFAVGDPKQSIYRFRRADVAQWRRLHTAIAHGGDSHHLEENFRSVPGIVAFVNAAFAAYPDYQPLRARRPAATLDPVVMLVPDAGVDDAVGRYLRALVGTGTVVDRTTGASRPVRWGDVMVLLPAWTRADELHATLMSAGIPSVVEGGRTFFQRDEVRLCRAVLQAIEEPGDAASVVFVLRGLFGVSLAELAQHRADGGSWRYSQNQPAGPAAAALATLAKVARRRGQVSWVSLLDDVLEQSGAPAVWSLLARGPSMLANVDKLRAVIREIEAHIDSGGELVERLIALAKEPDEDLPLAGSDADVVRITTYFKAKGLEAPVVILPYAVRKDDLIQHVVLRESDALLLKVKDLEPPGWDAAEAREKAERSAERRRWMYVAATRARDQLVIVRGPTPGLLDPDLLTLLPDETTPDDHLVEVAAGVSVRVRQAAVLTPVPSDESTFPGRDAAVDALLTATAGDPTNPLTSWRRSRKLRVAAALRRGRAWVSVTELAAGTRRAAGSGGTPVGREAGSAVHRVMQELDLKAPEAERVARARVLGRAFAAEMGLDAHHSGNVCEIAARLACHPIVARAAAAPEVWREVPFAVATATTVVTGTIDLMFPSDATRTHWVVADWKSELPALGDPKRAVYDTQLEHYARAVIENLGAMPITVERILVGPHPEYATTPADAWDTAQTEAASELGPLLARLREAAAPPPAVRQVIGEPAIATDVELVWADVSLALTLDHDADEITALRRAGWTIIEWDETRAVADVLAAALTVTLVESTETL